MKKCRIQNKSIKSILIIVLFLVSMNFVSSGLMNKIKTAEYNSELNNSFWEGEDKIHLTINIPEIETQKSFSYNGEQYYEISFESCGTTMEVGAPKVPFKTIKILLPFGTDLDYVRLQKRNLRSLEGTFMIEPAQEQTPIGSAKNPIFKLERSIYSSDLNFPEDDYKIEGVYEIRGYRILILNIYPVSYIPNKGKISYYKDIDIEVSLLDTFNMNKLLRGKFKDQEIISEIVDNPEVINTYKDRSSQVKLINPSFDLSPGSYDYLIITNNALKNSGGTYTFQDLALSKNASGIDTRIITTEYIYSNYPGDDEQEQIRNCIIDAYQTWGIEYVLLGGDGDAVFEGGESGDDIIPSRGLYATAYGEIDYNITSDLYYAALDGNWNDNDNLYWGEPGEDDLYAEVYIGRAPVDTETELSNFVYKTLAHEAETHHYLSKALMVGEFLGFGWSVWGGDYKDEIKDGSDAYGYTTSGFPNSYNVDTLYDRDLDPQMWNKTDLIPLLNDGIHIINHLGHCDVEYSMKMINKDADALINTHYFFAYSQGCYNGAFDNRGPWGMTHSNDSIAEHFVLSEHGAFAFVGNTRFGWGDNYGTNGASQYYDRQFFDALFAEGIEEIGKANQDSKEDNIGYISQEAMRWCYYQLNLMGDPCATLPPQPNDYEPNLTDEFVSSMSGDQTTLFTFKVNYTDIDNNPPLYVNVKLNETVFPMHKELELDEDYSDGCSYITEIYLQPGTYNYSFICADYKFTNSTGWKTGLLVSEKLNENNPVLNNGFISPEYGLANFTEFTFLVNYTDLDNNVPNYIQITVNSTTYNMVKQNPFDTNYMDGVIFEYRSTLEEIGIYEFDFECSDGLNVAYDGSYSGPIVKQSQLFEGMYIAHIFNMNNYLVLPGNISYNFISGNQFYANYDLYPYGGSWKVDALTRIMTEAGGTLNFGNNYHTPFWIFNNRSLGEVVPISVDGTGDHNFTITDELIYFLPDFGEIEVWVLEDNDEPGIAWYEKSTGILLNGTFTYYSGQYNYTFDFIDTNTHFSYSENNFEPMLTEGAVNPNSGDQKTKLNFSVTYTDLDNNKPIYINVVVNDTTYPLNKIDELDTDYSDGCQYEFVTFLQAGQYDYYFECADWIYSNFTLVDSDLMISSIPNLNTPTLTSSQLNPGTGYANATEFCYSVIYTDLDNDAPDFMHLLINNTIYDMYKFNISDNYYIDGCKYIYERKFEVVGFYEYQFNSTDGLFFVSDGPYLGPDVSKCQLFDGLYVEHELFGEGIEYPSRIEYSYKSGNIFKLEWFYAGAFYDWEENVETRIMDNPGTVLPFGEGYHTPFWINDDAKLNDNILIAVDGTGDHTFRVIGDRMHLINGFGLVEVWILEDLMEPSTRAYYEKSTGILINATFYYGEGTGYYGFRFVESNAKFSYSPNAEPTLTLGSVSPKIGNENTVFLFKVLYCDADNDQPVSISVLINSVSHSMMPLNISDSNYTDGCEYIYTTILPESATNYTYEFRANDGYHSYITTTQFSDLKVSSASTTPGDRISGFEITLFIMITGLTTMILIRFIRKKKKIL